MNEQSKIEITPELLEQNPLLAVALSATSLLVMLLLVGSLASWVYLIVRAWRGQPWLVVEPSAPRVWGLADLVVIAVLTVACQIFFASAYARLTGFQMPPEETGSMPAAIGAAASAGNIMAVLLSAAWIILRFGVSIGHVGFRGSGLVRQLQIAVISVLAVLPIVYLLMAAVSIGLKTDYKHPLLDEIRTTATLTSYLLGVFTAVLMAPLAEEFLFRGIIQGWLQSWGRSSPSEILLGASLPQRFSSDAIITANLVGETSSPPSLFPVEPPEFNTGEGHASLVMDDRLIEQVEGEPFVTTPPWWPAVVTGILFGLAHWGYGLSFIPLIVLGIVLGLLYRATHSLWPCIAVHMVLNGTSMLGLGLGILIERAKL